jgi:hypothetical protein
VLPSGFRLLDGDNPADPFIARERGNILPLCPRRWIGNKGFSQIRRQAMDYASGEFFYHGLLYLERIAEFEMRKPRAFDYQLLRLRMALTYFDTAPVNGKNSYSVTVDLTKIAPFGH